MASVSVLQDQAIEVARGWRGPDAPRSWQLTSALFEAIAADRTLLEAIASLPEDRLPALLAGAAITFLARRDTSAAIHAYFPVPGDPQPAFDAGFLPAFRAFSSARLGDILGVCHQRRDQMNEVARCSQLVCGLAAVAGPSDGPVALVDVGTGAGLALSLDRYRYRFGGLEVGPRGSPLMLACAIRGERVPPVSPLPSIAERIGIDIDPVDLEDDEAREWLEACAPPEATALTRLTAAIEVVRAHPMTMLAGDAVELVPQVLAGLPHRRPAVVVDSYTAVFLPEERRHVLWRALEEAGRARTVIWLSLDPLVPLGPAGSRSVQGLAVPSQLVADYRRNGVFAVLGARRFPEPADQGRLLARSHPSGTWLEWLDEVSTRQVATTPSQ
jgi:hypothetical protein